ncbi:MAG TPA: V-type ATP synthase subunit E [Candidatus Norongarragalinales archaeon]|nr:V-type ATP synthase subunit E [Candidatus Norongarragalinales archaeon]
MSLDALRAEINHEAEKERKKKIDSARHESALLIEKAEEDADAYLATSKEAALEEAKTLSSALSAARLEAKKVVSEARDDLVARELSGAKKTVLSFGSDRRYPSFLKKQLECALKQIGSEKPLIHVRKKDVPLLKKWGYSAGSVECAGGVLVSTPDGRIRVNATLESIFDQRKDLCLQKLYEELL